MSSDEAATASSGLARRRILLWIAIGCVLIALVVAIPLALRGRADPVYIAVAGELTGDHPAGEELGIGAQLAVDDLNRSGGVAGRPVELLTYEDGSDPDTARRRAEEIVKDGRALAVIGHTTSAASKAAGAVYAAAGLPVITPTATADDVTKDNEWYFRSVFSNSRQGVFLAAYTRSVLGARTASIVHENFPYGLSLRDSFVNTFASLGTVKHRLEISNAPGRSDASIDAAVATLAKDPASGPVIVALQPELGGPFITRLRARGVKTTVVGTDALGSEAFVHELLARDGMPSAALPPTANFYAAAPLITDAVAGPAVRWRARYRDRYGVEPGWAAATTHDALTLLAHAMAQPGIRFTEENRRADRQRIRDNMAGLTDPNHALAGLNGPIYFSANRSTVGRIAMGTVDGQRFVSAMTQLVPYEPTAGVNPQADLAAGRAVRAGDQLLIRQHIVTTGINLNEIGELDTRASVFSADLFIWFRYTGPDSAVDVEFVNGDRGNPPELSEPLRAKVANGVTYRLYRIRGSFKADLNFRHFPFDRQTLKVVLQNRSLPSSQVMYVIDRHILDQPVRDRLRSGVDADSAIDRTPNWRAVDAQFYHGAAGSTADTGDPEIGGARGIYYSQYITEITIERHVFWFLVKNLLPLLLLTAVTYVSLFFGYSETDTGTRVSLAITAVLSTAVLLSTVTGSLPDVSYTVAIEWLYYIYIVMAAGLVLVALFGNRLHSRNEAGKLRRLSMLSRIGYPMSLIVLAFLYYLQYG